MNSPRRGASRVTGHGLLLTLCLSAGAEPVDPGKLPPPAAVIIEFDRDIQPILSQSCLRCHGPEKPKSRFRLDAQATALKGGSRGVDIIPGDSAGSPLIHFVAGLVEDMEMPPRGKAEPLTALQIGLLRAWIDQGANWGAVGDVARTTLSVTPAAAWISVSGNEAQFRAMEGVNAGWNGGLESFSLAQQLAPDERVTVDGRALFGTEDFAVRLAFDRTEAGFVHAGFEQWRSYYDDVGGYDQPLPVPAFGLNRDLYLDIGRAWIDFGLTRPDGPTIVLGYEYQYRNGSKSTLEWGPVGERNIYPAWKQVDENTQIIKLDITKEWEGWLFENHARLEFNNFDNRRYDAALVTLGPLPDLTERIDESGNSIRGANTLSVEKQLFEWWQLNGAYYFSEFNGDDNFNQVTLDANNLPATGRFWSANDMMLERTSQVFSFASLFQPLEHLDLSTAVQAEWTRQDGSGDVNLDSGAPNNPSLFFLRPATVASDLDTTRITGNAGLRYTKIPFTVLSAEGRFIQERVSQFENEAGTGVDEAFTRDTDASNRTCDWSAGFSTSPWRWMSLSAEYGGRVSDSDYDHNLDVSVGEDGYSAFITERDISSDGVEAKLALRPSSWLKAALTFAWTDTDYHTTTDPVDLVETNGIVIQPDYYSPGGEVYSGHYRAQTYGLNLTLTPIRRLYFTGTFTFSHQLADTALNGVSYLQPYCGDIYSLLLSANFAVNDRTTVQGGFSYSHTDFGNNDVTTFDGLPLAYDYSRYGLTVGVTRKLSPSLFATVRYGFYQYSQADTGGVYDYSANGVYVALNYKWQ